MEDAGVRIDTYRMGEITARLRDRVEELEARAHELAGEEFMLGSTQQVARILFEKLGLTPGRKGKTGYSTDTRVLRTIRDEHEIVAVIEEWREYSKLLNTYLEPLPSLISARTAACTRRSTRRSPSTGPALDLEPEPAGDPDPHRARPRDPLRLRRRAGLPPRSRPTTRRSSCASSRTSPASRSCARRSRAARTSTRRPPPRCWARTRPTLTKDERNVAKMVNFGIIYGISAFGLSENLEIPREEAQAYIDAYLARFPHVQDFIQRTIEQAERDGYVTTLLGRRRPVPELRASNRQTRSLGERLAVNFVMQGTAADIIKVAMVAIHAPPARRRAGRRGSCSRCTTSSSLEVPERGVSAVKRARPRGDVRRLPARPAARGRHRRRRRLERSKELTAPLACGASRCSAAECGPTS